MRTRAIFVTAAALLLGQIISYVNNPGYSGRVAILVVICACYLGLWTLMVNSKIEDATMPTVAVAVACDLRYWNMLRAEFMEFAIGVLVGSILVVAILRCREEIPDRVQRLLTQGVAALLIIRAVFGRDLAYSFSRPAFPLLSGIAIIGSWIPSRARTIDLGALLVIVSIAIPSQFTSGLALFPVTAAAFSAIDIMTRHSVSLSRFVIAIALIAIIGSTTYESAVITWRKSHRDPGMKAEYPLDHA